MKLRRIGSIVTLFFCVLFVGSSNVTPLMAGQEIKLAADPDLSPDGKQLAFAWRGDIWIADAQGGTARQLTTSPSRDEQPKFSPDGKTIALISHRSGAPQVYLIPATGGDPTQLTFHSEGCDLYQWTADGESLLINGERDHFWRHAERLFLIDATQRPRERLLFDAYGEHGRLSPDENKLLFTREGERWWRKGYRGSRASQIWMFDLQNDSFEKLCDDPSGSRFPLWHPDGKSFYYVSAQSGVFNLWQREIQSGREQQLTHFDDDSVVFPCISSDGSSIVFRHLFDLYRLDLNGDLEPKRIELLHDGDRVFETTQRRILSSASDVSFSADGLEVAFIAGGDLWVMDTVLREPRQITNTPEEERDPAFAPDGESIWFASDMNGQSDIYKALRSDQEEYWWQNDSFRIEQISRDTDKEFDLRWSPDGRHVAFARGRGDLWIVGSDGSDPKRLVSSWNVPDFDWSPDGKWIVYAHSDNDFNRDIFVIPIDGSREPFNLSRHPDNDYSPVWSPDGKMIAFTGRRIGSETDMYFVYLQKSEHESDRRDRKLKEAIKKIEKARKEKSAGSKNDSTNSKPEKTGTGQSDKPESSETDEETDEQSDEDQSDQEESDDSDLKLPEVTIDFEDIDKRIRRIAIDNVSENGLFWSPDSEKLAFTAEVDGKRGTYTVTLPDELTPKQLSESTGSHARWIKEGNRVLWLSNRVPGSLDERGKATAYSFSAPQQIDIRDRFSAGFDLCWREMRDNFYDGNLNNLNWDAIRRKFASAARDAVDGSTFAVVVNMMLGELNGSHLGFSLSSGTSRRSDSQSWQPRTAHFGVRFDPQFKGPGLRIRDVILNSPADQDDTRLHAGEIILSIDSTAVDPEMELTAILNGRLDRDIHLRVQNAEGEQRDVVIRPISFPAARALLYEQWIHDNQLAVSELSDDRFGYLHIRGMNMTSFYRFERELYSVAAGKSGLVIDVRENGGGSTTDHLLTVLTQPVHAITVPRGGGMGYPHDRKVYASWSKPVVVLCNQNSFSNAEIFSHAIKTLKRGKLVGVPTAGGVISTGGARIMDLGYLRKPFRGWFLLKDGQDMELNGAVPDHIVWPLPGELPAGRDTQLTKAVDVLKEDVRAYNRRPQPKLVKASDRATANISWKGSGRNGAVAAGGSAAVAAGIQILQQGGNAADAAVATLLALSVSDYGSFAIGGEVPLLIYDAKKQEVKVLSGLGSAPLDEKAIAWFYENGIPADGSMKSAPVPGAIDLCVTALKEYGTISLEDAVQPTLRLLETRSEPWHGDLSRTLQKLIEAERDSSGSRLEKLTAARDRFYVGDVAHELEAWYIETGSMLRRRDLAAHRTRIEDPVTVQYRDYTVAKCGPWTQGPVLCQTLQLLEGFDLQEMGHLSGDYIHVVTEALKLGFADRDEYYGDPRFADVPLSQLLSDKYSQLRRELIDMNRASLERRPGNPLKMSPLKSRTLTADASANIIVEDTTTCVVADRWGNVVAATPSCNLVGNKPGPSGVTQGNRLRSLNTATGHPNRIEPGKRPRITLTPTLVLKNDRPILAISVAGGDLQDQTTLNVMLNHIEFGMLPEKAVIAPRFSTGHHQHSFNPIADREEAFVAAGSLKMNDTIDERVRDQLAKRGHKVQTVSRPIAHPVMLYLDPQTGVIHAAGDPGARRHAAALE